MKYTGAYFVMGFICLMIGINPPATAQTKKPKTAADIKENLENYRATHTFARETYSGEEITLKIPYVAPSDSLSKFSITSQLVAFLDYVPPAKNDNYQRVYYTNYFGGYRIQIYRGKSKEEAERARKRSYQLAPKATPYLIYSAPSYRVRVGDFLQTSELIGIYNVLKSEFPSALVVPDQVNITIMNNQQDNQEE